MILVIPLITKCLCLFPNQNHTYITKLLHEMNISKKIAAMQCITANL